MADIPPLSNSAKRMLALQWEALRENHKLTDEDISEYDRRRQQLTEVFSKWPHHDPRHRDPRHATQTAQWLGVTPSVRSAEARFRTTGSEFWSHWCASGGPYETYATWLETLKRDTVAELESIWKGHSSLTDCWFEETCKPAIEKSLSSLVQRSRANAREVEMKRLGKVRAEAGTRALDGLPKTNPNAATEPTVDELSGTDAGPTTNELDPSVAVRRTTDTSWDVREWMNLSPEDPRYKTRQLIVGALLREESNASRNLISNLKVDGAENAVLKLVEEKYDACGHVGVLVTENVAKAQEVAEILAEMVERTLEAFVPMFQVCEEHGISSEALLTKQARIRLLARREHWKAPWRDSVCGSRKSLTVSATSAFWLRPRGSGYQAEFGHPF
jgi:hypothetical protein